MGSVLIEISIEIPEMIAATQWDDDWCELSCNVNFKELMPFVFGGRKNEPEEKFIKRLKFFRNFGEKCCYLKTIDGYKVVNVGDWIVKDDDDNYNVISDKNFREVIKDLL